MKHSKSLAKAWNLLRAKKFGKLINYLEAQVFSHRENAEYYYLLGLACLKAGDLAGANSYLKRALHLEPHNEPALLCMAVLQMRKQDVETAIQSWLNILEINYSNKYAQRALNYVRKHPNDEDLCTLKTLNKFLSPPQYHFKLLGIISIIIFSIAAAIFFFPWHNFQNQTFREGAQHLVIEINNNLTESTTQSPYQFSEAEIQKLFQSMQEAFEQEQDHLVQLNINKILFSNASEELKQKVRLLQSYLAKGNFMTLKNSFSYNEVVHDPRIYNNISVRWKGRVANTDMSEDGMEFDFLVGYHDSQILEGILRSKISFPVTIKNGDALEVIGVIASTGDGTFHLVVTDLRQIIPTERP